ncbi:PH domain-containing protein [Staphylococcus sp. SQ8-PEA]|uniref:PH domain-containing protein n=1 Tax=Staphylococcus marylandisciuri TaxID=2981529 RepID=A0ABT2QRE1_9STAP|nr:PH domain-containing protein [Staphylococcus marylandisciuri]MCU5746545.1 PH domain-containing protein [Staphylococcus marylandisciuri]
MNQFNYMHPDGKKAMRITGSIVTLILVFLLVLQLLICKFLFHISQPHFYKWSLIIGGIIILLQVIIFVIISPLYKYRVFRYQMNERTVVIRTGLWFIETHRIPHFRIQNIDTYEGAIMRIFGLANVTTSTAGGNAEITLISKDEAQKLKLELQQLRNKDQSDLESH